VTLEVADGHAAICPVCATRLPSEDQQERRLHRLRRGRQAALALVLGCSAALLLPLLLKQIAPRPAGEGPSGTSPNPVAVGPNPPAPLPIAVLDGTTKKPVQPPAPKTQPQKTFPEKSPVKPPANPPPVNPPPANPPPANPPPAKTQPEKSPPAKTELAKTTPKQPAPPTPKPAPPRPQSLAEEVNLAVDRGVGYLRRHAERVQPGSREVPLVGLALLECGVRADDPVIERLAAGLRDLPVQDRQTYEVSLQLLFFDCLGKKEDEPLIQQLANVLIGRQYENGTWSYGAADLPAQGAPVGGAIRFQVQRQLGLAQPRPAIGDPSGDHSNTQFAALALWVAARHGVRGEEAIARTDVHFRRVQNPDGGWGYESLTGPHSDSMTCSALMSLAMGHAIQQKAPKIAAAAAGITIIQGVPRSEKEMVIPDRPPAIARGLAVLAPVVIRPAINKTVPPRRDTDSFYFLWSLQRLAMMYDLEQIGNRPWYPWAARWLVDRQNDDHWEGENSGPIDTAFALLVLKRSNRASDLTLVMRRAAERNELPFLEARFEMLPEPNRRAEAPPPAKAP
jgi:hypothetical protein